MPHVDSKEACAGSPDAGMQDGRRGRTCDKGQRAVTAKRAARVSPAQHRGREGYSSRKSSVCAPGQPEI